MGLFNPSAPLLADVNLLVQVTIILVLMVSLWFRSRQRYVKHGVTTGLAVALHTVSILVAMVPSFWVNLGLFRASLGTLTLVLLSHAVLGSLVEVFGLYLVGAWVLNRGDPKTCFRKKTIMLVTLTLWATEFILGVAVYLMFYPFS